MERPKQARLPLPVMRLALSQYPFSDRQQIVRTHRARSTPKGKGTEFQGHPWSCLWITQ